MKRIHTVERTHRKRKKNISWNKENIIWSEKNTYRRENTRNREHISRGERKHIEWKEQGRQDRGKRKAVK